MHKGLLMKVIKDQAGTLPKGILEGTMNLIEAGSPKGDIVFEVNDGKAILKINDKGRGIPTEKELIEHFETFGTPHDKSENKRWAKFRMGRGQLFAFGKNIWRTATFEMEVDIDNWGLVYHLKKNLPYVQGCQITVELYENPIDGYSYNSIDRFKDKIRDLVEFVSTPIYFNGEQINTPAEDLKWTFEDDDAYYLFGEGTDLRIYNLGAYVMSRAVYYTGVAGVIVSKKQLEVNFARNDIKSTCPIYRHIGEVVKDNRIKETRKKKYTAMSANQRIALLFDLRDGVQKYKDLVGKRIFKTSQGKWQTLKMIFSNKQKWTFAPDGSRKADSVMEKGEALCLSSSILSQLGYTGPKASFFNWLLKEQLRNNPSESGWNQNVCSWDRKEIQNNIVYKTRTHIPYDKNDCIGTETFECLTDGFTSSYTVCPQNKLTIVEKRVLSVLNYFDCWGDRRLSIGRSDEAFAWTDGETYIVLDKNYLKNINLSNKYEIHRLFATLIHELAHDIKTEGSHSHSPEFDARFREIIESYRSPFAHVVDFIDKMRRNQMETKKQRLVEKQAEIKRKRDKKLGIK